MPSGSEYGSSSQRRRVCNKEDWQANGGTGETYSSLSGKVIPTKKPGDDCECKKERFTRVPEGTRLFLFESFYKRRRLYGARGVSIKKQKIEDIKKLSQYIPDCFRDFYDRISEWDTDEGSQVPQSESE